MPPYKEASQIQIDSTYIKAHQHSAGAKKKTSRKRGLANREEVLPVKFMQ